MTMAELEKRVGNLERLVTALVHVERVTDRHLTPRERALWKRVRREIKEGAPGYLTLDELHAKLR